MTSPLSQHRAELARDLLDDIELSRLPADALLLKARRLARLIDAKEVDAWLLFELRGYQDSEDGKTYMTRMGRWIDKSKNEGYWAPLASVDAMAASIETQIQRLSVPSIHFAPSSANPHEMVTRNNLADKII